MATQGKIYIYKRKSKKGYSYTYRIEAGKDPITGKRRCVTKSGFKTAKEARIFAQPQLNNILMGQNISDRKILFSDYAYKWLQENSINRKKYTIKILEYRISILKKYFNQKQLKDISAKDCQYMLLDYGKNHANSSIKQITSCLKRILEHAVKHNIIASNPFNKVDIPPSKTEIKKIENLYLTKHELKNALEYIKYYCEELSHNSEYFYYMIYTMAFTGLRVGEACALLWNDIDFTKQTISVNSTMYGNSFSNYIRQNCPKTKSSIRTIFIDNSLLEILKEWRRLQLSLRIFHGTQGKRPEDDFVFTKYFPKIDKEIPLLPANIVIIFTNINRKGIFKKRLHSHMFRHTHASLLAEAGIPLEVIQERLGHRSDKTTTMIYLHITEHLKKSSIELFEKYMQG